MKKESIQSRILVYMMLIVFCSIFLLPFAWLVTTALKPETLIYQYPPVWIFKPTLQNFIRALHSQFQFTTFLANSLFICETTIILTIFSCSLVAYGFARIKWPGRDILFFVMLSTMMLPGQVTMIPVFMIFRNLGWINTFKPLIVPALFGNAFFIFLLRQFFRSIPQDLVDAARIDGCNELQIWWKIFIPLSKPAIATVGLFTFMNAWNDFMGPLIYLLDENRYTLPVGLAMFNSEYGSQYGQLMAVSTIMAIPMIITFFFAQRTFIQGIKLTGLKG